MGHLRGADLVHHRPVDGHGIGAHDDEVDIIDERADSRVHDEVRFNAGIIQCPDRDMPLVSWPHFGGKDLNLLAAPVRLDDAPERHLGVAVRQDRVAVTDVAGAELRNVLHRMPGRLDEPVRPPDHPSPGLFKCFALSRPVMTI